MNYNEEKLKQFASAYASDMTDSIMVAVFGFGQLKPKSKAQAKDYHPAGPVIDIEAEVVQTLPQQKLLG